MASKREIAEDIRRQYGNFLSQNQIRQYMGKGSHQTAEFVANIPFIRDGRKKSFFAMDVARKLYEQQQTAI